MLQLQSRLDAEVAKRDCKDEVDATNPDPIMIAKRYHDEYIALICALFSYGNAKLIVKFLESLDFSLLEKSDDVIKKALSNHYYRFQKPEDVVALFIMIKRAKASFSLEEKFYEGYREHQNVMAGLASLISALKELYNYESYGYNFLIGKVPTPKSTSTYKRWHMYLRWMVRKDNIDMGLWSLVERKDLLMPLDTHTFHLSQKLGLLKRTQYDLKAVIEVTKKLKRFDKNDPVKYDFALYRLGQAKDLAFFK